MVEYIFGIHPVEELLASPDRAIEEVWIQKGAKNPKIRRIAETANRLSLKLRYEERGRLDRLLSGGRHQGVVVRCSEKAIFSLDDLLLIPDRNGEDPFFLLLDRVEDPGNLGAVARTAVAVGVHGLILPKKGTAPLSGVAFKRSAGTLERLPVARVTNLVRTIEVLKKRGVWVIGTGAAARECYSDVDLAGPVALVIGGERGVRRLVLDACDRVVSIPMEPGVESLNLSVAAGLMLYEVRRNRRGKTP